MTEPLLLLGDCLERLRDLDDDSVDAIVTDPPYGLGKEPPMADVLAAWLDDRIYVPTGTGFMGKAWDAFVPDLAVWRECFRVLKPGGHLLAFSGTRTFELVGIGIRLAGFERRDLIAWLYGSGFPKSLDVSKAIDARDAAEERLARARRSQEWLRQHLTAQRIDEATGTAMGHHLTTHPTQPAVPTPKMLDQLRPLLPPVPEWLEDLVRERAVESENLRARKVVGSGTGTTAPGFAGDRHRNGEPTTWDVTVPHTEEARAWEGWGTALKPALEPIIVARKPLAGSVAENVLAYGVGALNIDATRVSTNAADREASNRAMSGSRNWRRARAEGAATFQAYGGEAVMNETGRWPANVVLSHTEECRLVGERQVAADGHWPSARPAGSDLAGASGHVGQDGLSERSANGETVEVWECSPECPVRLLDEQTGELRSGEPGTMRLGENTGAAYGAESRPPGTPMVGYGDVGGASRFFYTPKASRSERSAGLGDDFEARELRWSSGDANPGSFQSVGTDRSVKNHHPTVKPIMLMRWLVRLVAPAGAVVLDPFLGSGTTGIACALEGVSFVGIEREAEYLAIAEARIRHWTEHGDEALRVVAEREAADRRRREIEDAGQLDLFASG